MSKKLIALQHHVNDYESMWNGIEDEIAVESTS